MDIIGNLPVEISSRILRILDDESLVSASAVSERWHDLCESDSVLSLNLKEGLSQRAMDMVYYRRMQMIRWFVDYCFEEPACCMKLGCCKESVSEIRSILESMEKTYEGYKKEVSLRKLKKLSERESREFREMVEKQDKNMKIQMKILQRQMYEAVTGACCF
ncbi:hypothetical protein C0J52_10467 [Blattella germanica]|nr:hypothetical protein C0J52_10467 [Blattella germanica]